MAYLERHSGDLFDPDLVPRFIELLPDIRMVQKQYSVPAASPP